MSELRKLNENLEFVRGVVSRGRVNVGSPAIYFLWAAITGIGFSLPTIAPEFATRFWLTAIPGGGALSIWVYSQVSLSPSHFAWRVSLHIATVAKPERPGR